MASSIPRRRIDAIDIARGLALLAMASFHLCWDFEFFGYLATGTTAHGFLKFYARAIASSFLFLVGLSLVLAHGSGLRWRSFAVRFGMVAGAAGLISLGTYLAMPEGWIFFGILHEIALASLLALPFLRLSPLLTALAALFVIALPQVWRAEFFSQPAFWWTGLAPIAPRSNDYVPVFPWFGAVLVGVAAARGAQAAGLFERLSRWQPPRPFRPLAFLGRHSLAFYLLHQPVLIASVWLLAQAVPPEMETPEVRFMQACEAGCAATRDEDFCARYCACMLDGLEREQLLGKVFEGATDEEAKARIEEHAHTCTRQTEAGRPAPP